LFDLKFPVIQVLDVTLVTNIYISTSFSQRIILFSFHNVPKGLFQTKSNIMA